MTAILRRLATWYLARPRWLRALAPLSWMALVWWLSSRERPIAPLGPWYYNSAHVGVYGVLAALVFLFFGEGRRRGWLAFAITVAYGIVDEIHQAFVPNRVASVFDVMSDASGAAIACCLLGWLLHGHAGCRRALPWLVLAAILSVTADTCL